MQCYVVLDLKVLVITHRNSSYYPIVVNFYIILCIMQRLCILEDLPGSTSSGRWRKDLSWNGTRREAFFVHEPHRHGWANHHHLDLISHTKRTHSFVRSHYDWKMHDAAASSRCFALELRVFPSNFLTHFLSKKYLLIQMKQVQWAIIMDKCAY